MQVTLLCILNYIWMQDTGYFSLYPDYIKMQDASTCILYPVSCILNPPRESKSYC